jgi:hypothetical protein
VALDGTKKEVFELRPSDMWGDAGVPYALVFGLAPALSLRTVNPCAACVEGDRRHAAVE